MGCDHKLIAGEPHLWGCKVGTKLLWLQLDSVVVLVDCFLGTRTGPFRLVAFSLGRVMPTQQPRGTIHFVQKVPFLLL